MVFYAELAPKLMAFCRKHGIKCEMDASDKKSTRTPKP